MKIKEIEIKNFGKFSNQRFVFRDGIQVFYGENEFGKSTIYGFLKDDALRDGKRTRKSGAQRCVQPV